MKSPDEIMAIVRAYFRGNLVAAESLCGQDGIDEIDVSAQYAIVHILDRATPDNIPHLLATFTEALDDAQRLGDRQAEREYGWICFALQTTLRALRGVRQPIPS